MSVSIQSRIFTIRGQQVMLDSDLAELYQVETRVLNQAVKRNMDRFPVEFMFQLTREEFEDWTLPIELTSKEALISQSVTSKENRGGRRKLPFVFTEAGVSMLSAVLKSDTAIKMSVEIIRAFVRMRRFIANNALIFQEMAEIKQVLKQHDGKFAKVFEAIEAKEIKPAQGIFFDGQVFDAYAFVADLIKSAKQSIVLIDNYKVNSEGREGALGYVDESTLLLLSKRKKACAATIYTRAISQKLQLDLKKHNAQYPPVSIHEFSNSHDRFLILDDETVYHLGASLKDLGKKWFAFSKMDKSGLKVMERIVALPDRMDKGSENA